MTRDASFKKVVRRHAEETGQRYTEALSDLEGLGARMKGHGDGGQVLSGAAPSNDRPFPGRARPKISADRYLLGDQWVVLALNFISGWSGLRASAYVLKVAIGQHPDYFPRVK
jgi:hypothetical protein